MTRALSGVLQLYLVRHGESTWNVEGRVQGQTRHVPLTHVGVTQARDVAARLATAPIQRLYTSDLVRAAQTAEHISKAIGVESWPDVRLRERSYGVLEGRPNHEVPMLGLTGGLPPGGETFGAVVRRVGELLDECAAETARLGGYGVAMVTHGDTIAAALTWLHEHGGSDVARHAPGNGAVISASMKVGQHERQPVAQRLSR